MSELTEQEREFLVSWIAALRSGKYKQGERPHHYYSRREARNVHTYF